MNVTQVTSGQGVEGYTERSAGVVSLNELFAGAKNEEGLTHPWLIAATVVIAVFMEVLDTSIANVALPHIASNLSTGMDKST